MGTSISRCKISFPALAAALALNACMTGEGTCTTLPTPPPALALDPDSLVLIPTARSDHFFDFEGQGDSYSRYFGINVSHATPSSALSYFDSSGLSLFADSTRIATPPFWLQSGGMGQCGTYTGMTGVDIKGTSPDTAFDLQVRKDGAAARSWKVEFGFDGTRAPEFRVGPTANGLTAFIVVKPGTEVADIRFGGEIFATSVPYSRTEDTLRAEIGFKDIGFMGFRTDSAAINRAIYDICVVTVSGYESVTVDGTRFPGTALFYWGLHGQSRDRIVGYRKRYCGDCR